MTTTRRTFLTRLASAAGLLAFWRTAKAQDLGVKLPGYETHPMTIRVKTPERIYSIATFVDFEALLWAIAEKETGNRDDVIGPRGERSRYGITKEVWLDSPFRGGMPSPQPFETACRGHVATGVGAVHIAELHWSIPRRTLTERHEREYALAWCWHGGLSSWPHGTKYKPAAKLDEYARAVQALYQERVRQTKGAT